MGLNLRNTEVVKICWECGKKFNPVKGFELTSHFCSCECSNKYFDREAEKGVYKCRYCGKAFTKKAEDKHINLLCSKECKEAVRLDTYTKYVGKLKKNKKEGIVNEVGRRCQKSRVLQ